MLTHLLTCTPGDQLSITTESGKVHTVTITGMDRSIGAIYTTSPGKPRPGNKEGGLLRTEWGHFNPTLSQKAQAVRSVEVSPLTAI